MTASEQFRVRGVPFRQKFANLATILARAQHIHVQRAVTHFVIEIDRVRVSVALMRSQADVTQIDNHLLANVSEIQYQRIDIFVPVRRIGLSSLLLRKGTQTSTVLITT